MLLYLTSFCTAVKHGTIYRRHIHSLDKFHLRCLRHITGIKWQDKIPNTEVLEHCNMTGIEAMFVQVQLRWSGHLVRMSDTRLPKATFYSQLASGNRPCLVKRYKDALKKNLQLCNIDPATWETTAQDRSLWRSSASREYPILNINASQTCNRKENRGRLVSRQLLCLTTVPMVPSVDVDVLPPSDSTPAHENSQALTAHSSTRCETPTTQQFCCCHFTVINVTVLHGGIACELCDYFPVGLAN